MKRREGGRRLFFGLGSSSSSAEAAANVASSHRPRRFVQGGRDSPYTCRERLVRKCQSCSLVNPLPRAGDSCRGRYNCLLESSSFSWGGVPPFFTCSSSAASSFSSFSCERSSQSFKVMRRGEEEGRVYLLLFLACSSKRREGPSSARGEEEGGTATEQEKRIFHQVFELRKRRRYSGKKYLLCTSAERVKANA